MRFRKALFLATAGVVALVAGVGHAAAPTIEITTAPGIILNAPMLPAEAGIQLNGHIDGLVASDAALDCEDCSVEVAIAGESGAAALDCDDVDCLSGSWVFFLPFPIMPGEYEATATVTDADGATATDTIAVTVL